MELWQVIVLAIVQGLTEFLPVSSSGHLVIGASLIGANSAAVDISEVTIALHLGTLAAILVYFRQRIAGLFRAQRPLAWRVIVGTIPAVLVGLPLELWFEDVLGNPLVAASMLVVTGGFLYATKRMRITDGTEAKTSYQDAGWIGVFQAVAVLPGLSRSGLTIFAGQWRGLSPKSAATFSFLLAIPVIAGAGTLKLATMVTAGTLPATPWLHLLIGMVCSFLIGLAALSWLMKWLEQGRLWWFAYWCIPLGIAVLGWQLWPGG